MFDPRPSSCSLRAYIFILATVLLQTQYTLGQVSITGNTSNPPDDAAMLDVQASDKGMLVPRVALQSADNALPISPLPPTSLLIYNTATAGVAPNYVTPGYYYWNGSGWTRLMSGNGTPAVGTGAADKVAFWSSQSDLTHDDLLHWDNTNKRLGVGLDNPSVRLQVAGGIIATDDISATAGNLHTNRRRVVFSSIATDVNHSIYNNYTDIDGEGSWDGMKMNVFEGLDVRTGNAGLSQQVSNLLVTDGFVRAGRLTGPSTLEIGDVNTGEWRISTGGFGLSVSNDFDDNGTYDTRLYLRNTGNVGIGNTAPGHRLSVGDATTDVQSVSVRGYSDIGSWKGGAAFGYNSSTVIMGQLNGVATVGGHNATLGAWADLAINSGGGNVGIGTFAPQILLDTRANSIIGTSATTGSQHDAGNQGTKVSFGTTSGGEFAGMRLLVAPGTNACGNTGDIRFDTWECNTALSREVMRISGRGRVGIGTPSPSHRLQIEGTNDALRLVGTGTLGAQAKINFGDENYVYIEETSDDHLTIHANQGTRIGNLGNYMRGMYHGRFNVGNNNGNQCSICVFTGWSGNVLEIQVPWSALGIPNGTDKTVMLMADGNNNDHNDNWNVSLQRMTTDRMDIFIDRVDGSVWGLETLRLHYIILSGN
jgi:hypothetical protein